MPDLIAKGSKSVITVDEETLFNEEPKILGDLTTIGFSSESLAENINNFQSDELRSDRMVPAVRGGNISTGGGLTTDFAPHRHVLLLEHLLGRFQDNTGDPTDISNPQDWAGSASYNRGDYVENTNGDIYLVVTGGTSGGAEPTHTSGEAADGGGVIYQYLTTDTPDAGTVYAYRWDGSDSGDLPAPGLFLQKIIDGYGPAGSTKSLCIGFPGTRIGSCAINIPQEGIVTADWQFAGMRTLAKEINSITGGSPGKPYGVENTGIGDLLNQPTDEPFSGVDCFVGIGGQPSRPVQTGNITINNSLDESVYVIGSRFRRGLPEGRREVSGSITTYFSDKNEYEYFKNEDTVAMTLEFARRGRLFVIDLEGVKFTGQGTPSTTGEGAMSATFNFNAFLKDGGSYDIRMNLWTDKADIVGDYIRTTTV